MTDLQLTPYRQPLTDWSFKAADETEWLQATVPGTVHTDLLAHGKIPDPFYGTNEKDVQWIDKKDWEYITTVTIEESTLRHSHVELVFHGLDTYADVHLNGQLVLSADNMFRTWRADVKAYARAGENTLRIVFRSPIQEDLPKLEALGYPLPASNDQSDVGELGDKRVSIFARKAPYHYGWDWGPRFVTSGIWREAELVAWSDVRIESVFIRQDTVTAESAELTAVIQVYSEIEREANIHIRTDSENWEQKVTLQEGTDIIELPLTIEQPRLWWSRGLGEANLYTFTTEVLDATSRKPFAQQQVRTGLRSVRLVREQHADMPGTSFYFELNGVPVFAKGANHIPNDSFSPRVTRERYLHEIASAVDANMNMLRVWGGGIYENNDFYELCDEYGILVWQDFMFACSMYPGDEAFLDSVQAEAEDNVRRLRNHPSIVLWCGNNEIDSAWAHYVENGGWGWKKDYTEEQRNQIWADYEAVFHELLPEVVEAEAPGAEYWPSSPLVDLTGDEHQHARSLTDSGDIHYWGVWHGSEPFENYNVHVGRFMSEYGFQSFPEYRSVRTYAEESDLELESEVMLRHQKNGSGNRLIKEYMDKYLPQPKDFPSFLYMSQVLQAEAMQMAIEAHRRNKPYCMGTLYWQMNDCWPVASWAGIDYYGRWKALHYHAKRSFRDLAVSVDGTSGEHFDIYTISDILSPAALTLRVKVLGLDGGLYKEIPQSLNLAGGDCVKQLSLSRDHLLDGVDPQQAVLLVELEHDGEIVDSKLNYFVPAKDIVLEQPNITVTETNEHGVSVIKLTTDKLARQVWLSADNTGEFSDNYFDLLPGQTHTVYFRQMAAIPRRDAKQPEYGTRAAYFTPTAVEGLKVTSMADYVEL